MTTATYKDFYTGKKVTCVNTGKKWGGGKILWVDPETGIFYERTNPYSQTCVRRGKFFFRAWNEPTQEAIKKALFQ